MVGSCRSGVDQSGRPSQAVQITSGTTDRAGNSRCRSSAGVRRGLMKVSLPVVVLMYRTCAFPEEDTNHKEVRLSLVNSVERRVLCRWDTSASARE